MTDVTISAEAQEMAERDLPCCTFCPPSSNIYTDDGHNLDCPASHRPAVAAQYQRHLDQITLYKLEDRRTNARIAELVSKVADLSAQIAAKDGEMADMAMLIKRMARKTKKLPVTDTLHTLGEGAIDYLVRHNLQGSPLREDAPDRSDFFEIITRDGSDV